jgi:hypothetical protein
MIQRLQSIYLFAIIVLALLTCTGRLIDFQNSVATNTVVNTETNATETVVGSSTSHTLNAIYLNTYVNGDLTSSKIQYLLIVLVALIVGWSLNIILGFKNRKTQMRNTNINFIFIGGYLIAVLITAYTQIPGFTFVGMTIKASIGLALILFMLYLNLRTLLLIKKDDELVKSADRLR